jgi:hypothetical protein
LPPQLLILWREQHPDAEYQLPLPFDPLANHESARTTGLYDRRNDQVSLDEVERILIRHKINR